MQEINGLIIFEDEEEAVKFITPLGGPLPCWCRCDVCPDNGCSKNPDFKW